MQLPDWMMQWEKYVETVSNKSTKIRKRVAFLHDRFGLTRVELRQYERRDFDYD